MGDAQGHGKPNDHVRKRECIVKIAATVPCSKDIRAVLRNYLWLPVGEAEDLSLDSQAVQVSTQYVSFQYTLL